MATICSKALATGSLLLICYFICEYGLRCSSKTNEGSDYHKKHVSFPMGSSQSLMDVVM